VLVSLAAVYDHAVNIDNVSDAPILLLGEDADLRAGMVCHCTLQGKTALSQGTLRRDHQL